MATYLIKLKTHMESLLLKDYYKAVQSYSNYLKYMPLLDASQQITDAIPEDINALL